MPRTAAVDRPDFHAWRAYRIVVDAETAAEQTAKFEFIREGHGRAGVWIHGGQAGGIRIGAVHTTTWEFANPITGAVRKKFSYSAVADAAVANATVSPALPVVTGLGSREAAAALLYGRWIERRARHAAGAGVDSPGYEPGPAACKAAVLPLTPQAQGSGSRIRTGDLGFWRPAGTAELPHPAETMVVGGQPVARMVFMPPPGRTCGTGTDYLENPGVRASAAEPATI